MSLPSFIKLLPFAVAVFVLGSLVSVPADNGVGTSGLLEDVSLFRMPGGGIAVKAVFAGAPDPARFRAFFDTEPGAGEAASGADWMVEGPTFYKHPEGVTGWSWEPAGTPAYQVDGNTLVCLVASPELKGDVACRVEVTTPDWKVADSRTLESMNVDSLPEFASQMFPAPPPMEAFLKFRPRSLSVDWNGGPLDKSWQEIPLDENPIACKLDGKPLVPEVTLEDAASGKSAVLRAASAWSQAGRRAWSGEVMGIGWVLVAEDSPGSAALTGWLKSDTDRCLSVRVAFPMDPRSAVWHDDIQTRRKIEGKTTEAGYFGGSRYGKSGRQSFYPFGVVETSRGVDFVETDPDEPRVYHIAADPKREQMAIVYDIALSQQTTKFPGQATFRCRFGSLPPSADNAFRRVLADFFKRHPDFEKRRVASSGLWMPFFDISKIPNPEDFGFAFLEKGGEIGEDVDYAKAHGILTLMYTEPWIYWHPMPAEAKRTPENVLERMRLLAMSGDAWPNDLAASALTGAVMDSSGNVSMRFLDVPWNSGARMEVNTDPDLAPSPPSQINRAMAEWRQISRWLDDGRVDGVYLDSMDTTSVPDYRPASLEATDYPASFTLADLKPVIADRVGQYEFTAALGSCLRSCGKYLMGNFPVVDMPFLNRWIDIPGEETCWLAGGEYHPPGDAKLNYRRAMSGQKPYGFLQAADFNKFQGDMIVRYFQTCLFFGFQASFFSHDGANNPYWLNPDWYERDRPLFRTYVPLIRRVADAGWQALPEVALETHEPGILIEQFGKSADGIWHVTVRNTAKSSAAFSLKWSPPDGGSFAVLNPLTGETGRLSARETFSTSIDAGSVVLLDLMAPGQLARNLEFFRNWNPGGRESKAASVSLESLIAEEALGLDATIDDGGMALVEGEPAKWTIHFKNRSDRDLKVDMDGNTKDLPAGGTATLPVNLPARSAVSQEPVLLSWNVTDEKTVTACRRALLVQVRPRIAAIGPGKRIVSLGKSVAVPVSITNNSSKPADLSVDWSGDLGEGQRAVELPAGETSLVTLVIPSGGKSAGQVSIHVVGGGKEWFSGSIHAVFSDGSTSLAAQSSVAVSADSTFTGYSTGPLNDGVSDPTGLAWNEAAWASDDSPSAHWVQFDFAEPQKIKQVVLDWNVEGGVTYTARRGSLVGVLTDGSEVTLAKIANQSAVPRTTVCFGPRELKAIRVVQSPGGGAPERPGILWLREIGVY